MGHVCAAAVVDGYKSALGVNAGGLYVQTLGVGAAACGDNHQIGGFFEIFVACFKFDKSLFCPFFLTPMTKVR